MKKLTPSWLVPFIVPALFLFIWHYATGWVDNKVILPSISSVLQILLHPMENIINMGSLFTNILVSLTRVLTGYILAVVIGVPLGILMGYNRFFLQLLSNFLGIFRPIPPLAWVPLVLAWFGVSSLATLIGLEKGQTYIFFNNLKLSMIFIIFIGAFFPILTASIYGVSTVRKTLIDSSRVLGASELDVFCKVLLPAAAPSIVTGLRTGLGVAWMCLVSAEMLPGSLSGVGYLITHAYTIARTDVVIAGMISIGVVGAMLDYIFRHIEERRFKWQRLSR